ncbi:hypothetical protein N7517_010528 [Penicillium concentricum]|uniref:Transcription factor domain-containing protein n=1 Tax=Penicillium concentricum TaxID=293559 RepID=A0A9W9RAZ0_9EURO|nr:uncharacterized protein N7517_010528 [Penicillium concentricum]KAJ5355919.1 hypothetical protein N7517_010528 [Penicillium concentricum]
MNLPGELGGYDLSLLDFSWSFPWDVPTPRPHDGIINWPTGGHLLQAKPGEVSTSLDGPAEKITGRRRGKSVLRTDGTLNPYANCPFEYRFKRGPTVNAHRIYTFLHDQESWEQVKSAVVGLRTNQPIPQIVASLRDTIVARVHGMLYKLLDRSGFLHRFPPLDTIEYCYHAYQQTFSKLYPIVHPTSFLKSSGNTQDPDSDIGLFLATTMALGCLVIPVEKARAFSVELVYLIRFTITDNAFQDEICLIDKWVLSAWIMTLAFSAWSGSKRHMEIAEAFKGIPSTVCRKAPGMAELPLLIHEPSISFAADTTKPGLIPILEANLKLATPGRSGSTKNESLGFVRLQCPMPVSDELFLLDNEDQWREMLADWTGDTNSSTKIHPPSLASIYRMFLRHNFFNLKLSVTPLQLRLLLCPIQTQVIQYSQRYRFVPMEEGFESSTPVPETAEFVRLHQQEELEKTLVKWNLLSEQVFDGLPPCQSQTTPLLLSQLVWVELYICFDDVQLIAGKDGFEVGKTYLPQLQRWAQSPSAWKAIARAGNVVRILQSSQDRPVWWPIAVSRIALVMWCYAVGLYSPIGNVGGVNSTSSSAGSLIVLNDPTRDMTTHGRNIHPGESIICIQDSDGLHIPLHDVPRIFDFYIQMLDDSKSLNSPLLNSSRNFLQDIKDCGIPYAEAEDGLTC